MAGEPDFKQNVRDEVVDAHQCPDWAIAMACAVLADRR